jgi:hypothetical protein
MRWEEARGGRAGFRIAECSVVLIAELRSTRRFILRFVGFRFGTRSLGSGDTASRLGRGRRVACGERHLQFPRKLPVLFVLGLPILFFLGLAILLCFGHRALQSISIALRRINQPMRYFSHVRPEHEHRIQSESGL